VRLEISTRESSGVTIVDMKGRATIGAENDLLEKHLRQLVANGARNLLLNLADLTQVDSSGIATIANTFVSLGREGGSLKLLCPHGRVREALGVTRLLERIAAFEDEAEAVSSFHADGRAAT
jgi:anti-sigma B factor antagonist